MGIARRSSGILFGHSGRSFVLAFADVAGLFSQEASTLIGTAPGGSKKDPAAVTPPTRLS
jgi:hypothetical protein